MKGVGQCVCGGGRRLTRAQMREVRGNKGAGGPVTRPQDRGQPGRSLIPFFLGLGAPCLCDITVLGHLFRQRQRDKETPQH